MPSSPRAGTSLAVLGRRTAPRRPPRAAPAPALAEVPRPQEAPGERCTCVIDLGSNSFRLVVFNWVPGSWWKRTDEIFETVRIGAGATASGHLSPERVELALSTLDLYAHFCHARDIPLPAVQAVATSAIREAADGDAFVARARAESGLPVRVLTRDQEAWYGYLAAVNSSSLQDGLVLDLGGGSLQLVEVGERLARRMGSWPLGAVRMTERFLTTKRPTRKELAALRAHAAGEVGEWLSGPAPAVVGLGGTVRNLATAAKAAAGLPVEGVQGFVLTREALGELVAELARHVPGRRHLVTGIKPGRAEIILAGAVVVEAVMEAAGVDGIEVTEEGLREGVFFERYLAPADPPMFASVREASVLNLARQCDADMVHARHVADLSLEMLDALGAEGLHRASPGERELLWAASILHDVGMAVDYDDHHKHSRYLILSQGLPGFTPREVALIAQMARYHRKGSPGLDDLGPLGRRGDEALVVRCAALLRLAEYLDRSRDQMVRSVRLRRAGGATSLELVADGDPRVARWGAERQGDLFQRAFGRALRVRG